MAPLTRSAARASQASAVPPPQTTATASGAGPSNPAAPAANSRPRTSQLRPARRPPAPPITPPTPPARRPSLRQEPTNPVERRRTRAMIQSDEAVPASVQASRTKTAKLHTLTRKVLQDLNSSTLMTSIQKVTDELPSLETTFEEISKHRSTSIETEITLSQIIKVVKALLQHISVSIDKASYAKLLCSLAEATKSYITSGYAITTKLCLAIWTPDSDGDMFALADMARSLQHGRGRGFTTEQRELLKAVAWRLEDSGRKGQYMVSFQGHSTAELGLRLGFTKERLTEMKEKSAPGSSTDTDVDFLLSAIAHFESRDLNSLTIPQQLDLHNRVAMFLVATLTLAATRSPAPISKPMKERYGDILQDRVTFWNPDFTYIPASAPRGLGQAVAKVDDTTDTSLNDSSLDNSLLSSAAGGAATARDRTATRDRTRSPERGGEGRVLRPRRR